MRSVNIWILLFFPLLIIDCKKDPSLCDPDYPCTAEMIMPAIRDTQWADARCNNGNPFGFHYRESPLENKSNEWVIVLMGGGVCDDNILNCSERQSELLTAGPISKFIDGSEGLFEKSGILDPNPSVNPTFYSANHVFAYYCSSDAWSGITAERRPTTGSSEGWYFSGRINVRAMLEILIRDYGLNDNNAQTKVLLVGVSAGGTGIISNAETAKELLPNTATSGRLKLVADGSWLPIGWDNSDFRIGSASSNDSIALSKAHEFWGGNFGSLCETAYPENPGVCVFKTKSYPYITNNLGIDVLIQQCPIDNYYTELHGIDKSNPAHSQAVESWRILVLESMKNVKWLFSDGGSQYHTISLNKKAIKRAPKDKQGKSFYNILTRFWQSQPGSNGERIVFNNPDAAYNEL